jgi:hypothetical protein
MQSLFPPVRATSRPGRDSLSAGRGQRARRAARSLSGTGRGACPACRAPPSAGGLPRITRAQADVTSDIRQHDRGHYAGCQPRKRTAIMEQRGITGPPSPEATHHPAGAAPPAGRRAKARQQHDLNCTASYSAFQADRPAPVMTLGRPFSRIHYVVRQLRTALIRRTATAGERSLVVFSTSCSTPRKPRHCTDFRTCPGCSRGPI